MNPKQNEAKRNEEETIQDVSGDEAEKVAGGTKFSTVHIDGTEGDPEPAPTPQP